MPLTREEGEERMRESLQQQKATTEKQTAVSPLFLMYIWIYSEGGGGWAD